MSESDLEVGLKARLSAQHHVLAFVLAMVHRDIRDPVDAIDEIGRGFISTFMEGVDAHAKNYEPRNFMTAEYIEEMSSIMRLAGQIAARIKS